MSPELNTDSITDLQETSSSISIDYNKVSIFENCQLENEATENFLEVNGIINGDGKALANLTDETGSLRYTILGQLEVSNNENGDGVCGIYISIDVNTVSQTGSITGNICGDDWSYSVSEYLD